MSLDRFQKVLARLTTDRAFRTAFFTDRVGVLSEIPMEDSDRETLMRISQEQIERFARSLHGKRRTEILPLIPWTTAPLGDRFDACFEAHCEAYHPRGLLKPGDDARAFCERMAVDSTFSQAERETFRWEASRWSHRLGRLRFGLFRFRCCPRTVQLSDATTRYITEPGMTLVVVTRKNWRSRASRRASSELCTQPPQPQRAE